MKGFMSWLFIALFAIAGAVSWLLCPYSIDRGLDYFLTVVALATALIWLAASAGGGHYNQIRNLTNIQALLASQRMHEERREKLSIIIRNELSKYPEIEKQIIGDIKPDLLLLNFPNLKSDGVIMKISADIVSLENAVYDLRERILQEQKEILFREHNPWIICSRPSYRDYFGCDNPIARNHD